ncbi:MAG: L-type lectin-domain containing protein [Myxococcota bacterium]
MKKSFAVGLLLVPSLAMAQSSIEEFALGGSASPVSRECIRLTPDEQYVSGSAWYKAPVNLARPFEMELKIVLGEKDLEGADGIVFVFHPSPQTGWRGEGMGFAGLVPSLGIEFDTYQNFHLNDPPVDHLALLINGEMVHGGNGLAPVAFNNLEDGKRHPLKISWEPNRGLKIMLDGKLRAAYPAAIVKATFGGTPIVYWGMTAGTGRLSNYQDVCIEKLFIGA